MSAVQPQRLGDYLLIERVGEGGMAEVFRAQYCGDETSVGPQSVVVVKRIKSTLFKSPEFPIFREMFLNEAKLLRALQHPNLARMYALAEAVDQTLGVKVPFIVGEFIKGYQLWELMRMATHGFTGRPVPPHVAAYIVREMARGLGHAHNHKEPVTGRLLPIIHRDISPENVMISSEGQVKVIDFGVAKAIGGFGPQTQTGIIKGKLAYLAPEQVAQKVLPATDVFGAGIVLHELLTGRRLFGGSNDFMVITRVLKSEIPSPGRMVPGIPKELDEVAMKALSRDLRARYTDGNAFADALTTLLTKVPGLKGTTNDSIKKWAKDTVAEAERLSSGWQDEESSVPVDLPEELAAGLEKRSTDAPVDGAIELSGDDLMFGSLEGAVHPGVKAVVTMGLKTLNPEMLKKHREGSVSDSGFQRALPGAKPAAASKPAAPVAAERPKIPTPPPMPASNRKSPTELPVIARSTSGGNPQLPPRTTGGSAPVAPKVTPAGNAPVGAKVTPGGTAPVGPKVTPGGSAPVAARTATGGNAPVGPKVTPGGNAPISTRSVTGGTAPVFGRVTPAGTSPVGVKIATGGSAPVGPKVTPGGSAPIGRRVTPAGAAPVAAGSASEPPVEPGAPGGSATGGVVPDQSTDEFSTPASSGESSASAASTPAVEEPTGRPLRGPQAGAVAAAEKTVPVPRPSQQNSTTRTKVPDRISAQAEQIAGGSPLKRDLLELFHALLAAEHATRWFAAIGALLGLVVVLLLVLLLR